MPKAAGLVVAAVLVVLAGGGCTRARALVESLGPPTPTPTPSWVGKIVESATPVQTFQSRVADVDPRTGRPLTASVALREGPGRGTEPTGFTVQPGERLFITGVETVGGERYFKVRSFDGLKRGWIAEGQLAPGDRPPG